MRIGYKVSCLAVATALLATGVLTAIGYTTARRQYYAGIDRQLTAAAAALPSVVGETYLANALSLAAGDSHANAISGERYDTLVLQLSDLADRSGVYYLYIFTMKQDQIVHLTTSASAQERAGKDWSALLEPYEVQTDLLPATFADGQTRFAEYTDSFGSFRSIFVRHSDSSGRNYVVGVDVSLNDIHHDLHRLVMSYVGTGALVSLLAGALGTWLAHRISRPILELSGEVEAWSSRGFANDESIRSHLVALASRQRDEAGDLARRFVDVQDRLQSYFIELTQATQERQKIEHQLEIAKSIQEGLLPEKMPHVSNFEIFGWSKPADQTGGDYFDWVELPDGKIMLTIGDVTGHGIGPALVTAAARAYARATLNSDEALELTVARLNDLLHTDLKGDRFVTLIACLLDPLKRQMKLVAAGHGPVMFYSKARDQVILTEDTHGVPLGAFENFQYDKPTDLRYETGDVLVLVSDGFYDWMDASGEVFGTERLRDSVLKSCRTDPTTIIDQLRADIAAFNGGQDQHDDTTALVIRCIS